MNLFKKLITTMLAFTFVITLASCQNGKSNEKNSFLEPEKQVKELLQNNDIETKINVCNTYELSLKVRLFKFKGTTFKTYQYFIMDNETPFTYPYELDFSKISKEKMTYLSRQITSEKRNSLIKKHLDPKIDLNKHPYNVSEKTYIVTINNELHKITRYVITYKHILCFNEFYYDPIEDKTYNYKEMNLIMESYCLFNTLKKSQITFKKIDGKEYMYYHGIPFKEGAIANKDEFLNGFDMLFGTEILDIKELAMQKADLAFLSNDNTVLNKRYIDNIDNMLTLIYEYSAEGNTYKLNSLTHQLIV